MENIIYILTIHSYKKLNTALLKINIEKLKTICNPVQFQALSTP